MGGLVGRGGDLAVTRLLENSEPYTGSVELVSGEIAEEVVRTLVGSGRRPRVAYPQVKGALSLPPPEGWRCVRYSGAGAFVKTITSCGRSTMAP